MAKRLYRGRCPTSPYACPVKRSCTGSLPDFPLCLPRKTKLYGVIARLAPLVIPWFNQGIQSHRSSSSSHVNVECWAVLRISKGFDARDPHKLPEPSAMKIQKLILGLGTITEVKMKHNVRKLEVC